MFTHQGRISMTSRNRTFSLLAILALLLSVVFSSSVTARDAEQRVTFEQPILVVNTSFLNVRTGPGVEYSVLFTAVGGTELPVLGVASDQVWYQVNTDGGPGWVNIEFTLPRGDFSRVPLATANETARFGQGGGGSAFTLPTSINYTGASFTGGDLFNAPDYDSLRIRSGLAARPNTVYPLLAETENNGFQWYQIFIPEIGTVWTDKITLRPLACGGTRAGVLIDEQPIRFDSIANRDSYLLPIGTEFYILNVTDVIPDNFRVRLLDGTVGFVPAEFVRDLDVNHVCEGVPASATNPGQGGGIVDAQATGNRVVINTGNLNVRSGPGGTFGIVTTLSGGAEVSVIGRTSAGEWYLIQTNAGRGWVDKDFVVFRGVYDTIPIVNQSVGIPEGSAATSGNRVIVNTGNLNIRSGPSASFSVVATVSGGTTLQVIGRAPDNVWYLVEGMFGRGWLNSQFTIFRGVYGSVPVVEDTFIAANPGQGGGATAGNVSSGRQVTGVVFVGGDLYQQPDVNSLKLRSALPARPDVIYPLLEQRDIRGKQWYRIDYPGVGLAWTDRINLRLLECGGDQVGVLQEQAPIRFDGIANRDSFLLQGETEFYIVGRRDQFAIVELQDGTRGLLLAELIEARSDNVRSICENVPSLTGDNTQITGQTSPGTAIGSTQAVAPSGNRVVINTGNLNIRSGPSASFSVVTTVAGATTLNVVGRAPDGVWYLVEGTFGRGWLNSEFVVFRGNYSTVPVVDF
jgi:uncharacterized protein YgiM (DUF1202 family)